MLRLADTHTRPHIYKFKAPRLNAWARVNENSKTRKKTKAYFSLLKCFAY